MKMVPSRYVFFLLTFVTVGMAVGEFFVFCDLYLFIPMQMMIAEVG